MAYNITDDSYISDASEPTTNDRIDNLAAQLALYIPEKK